jgi:hypothetical protein
LLAIDDELDFERGELDVAVIVSVVGLLLGLGFTVFELFLVVGVCVSELQSVILDVVLDVVTAELVAETDIGVLTDELLLAMGVEFDAILVDVLKVLDSVKDAAVVVVIVIVVGKNVVVIEGFIDVCVGLVVGRTVEVTLKFSKFSVVV